MSPHHATDPEPTTPRAESQRHNTLGSTRGAQATPAVEVRVEWRTQFEGERTRQTDVVWDQDGRMISGVVTLATFDHSGQPLGTEDIRVLALHEIGHVIGLDHCSDSSNLMFPRFNVRDLSPRDIATALLLYQLPPGPVRAGR